MADSNNTISIQPLPRPSDIPSFMKYAKEKLGIMDAALYITPLQENRLGPDILGDTDMETFTSSKIGIPYRDALCLCKATPFWWSSHLKWCRDSEDENDQSFNQTGAKDGQNNEHLKYGSMTYNTIYPHSNHIS